jgi:hypothetical protein
MDGNYLQFYEFDRGPSMPLRRQPIPLNNASAANDSMCNLSTAPFRDPFEPTRHTLRMRLGRRYFARVDRNRYYQSALFDYLLSLVVIHEFREHDAHSRGARKLAMSTHANF